MSVPRRSTANPAVGSRTDAVVRRTPHVCLRAYRADTGLKDPAQELVPGKDRGGGSRNGGRVRKSTPPRDGHGPLELSGDARPGGASADLLIDPPPDPSRFDSAFFRGTAGENAPSLRSPPPAGHTAFPEQCPPR